MSEFKTDVDGVFADDYVTYGEDQYPVFDVNYSTWDSAKNGRRRISAEEDSAVFRYTRNSQINRAFYVRTENNGEQILRKVEN